METLDNENYILGGLIFGGGKVSYFAQGVKWCLFFSWFKFLIS